MRIWILLFSSLTFKMPTKMKLILSVFLLINYWRYISSFFKDKKSKRSHKSLESRFFLLFLIGDRRIQIRIHTSESDPDLDPGGPDPQHCSLLCTFKERAKINISSIKMYDIYYPTLIFRTIRGKWLIGGWRCYLNSRLLCFCEKILNLDYPNS